MALRDYRLIANGRKLPAYIRSRRQALDLECLEGIDTGQLWAIHDHLCISRNLGKKKTGSISLLDIKTELAKRILGKCRLCERRCGVDRLNGEVGFCGVGTESFYFFEQTLLGEEPPLVPSHEVFFSGCNLRCKFCYSWESLLNPKRGVYVDTKNFADLIMQRRLEGAVNLNLIGGEPTVHLLPIFESLRLANEPTAVVWNSNFYMSDETMHLLNGVVDLYLGDFRFGNDTCASRIGGVNDYCAAVKRNFLMAAQSGDLIIRHLVLPGHVDCCLRPIAQWITKHLPDVPFNLMFQYTPFFEALDDPELCRSLTPDEEKEAIKITTAYGLKTTRWKQPLKRGKPAEKIGKGEITTTITIRPDGRVGFMHLHSELLKIAQLLAEGVE